MNWLSIKKRERKLYCSSASSSKNEERLVLEVVTCLAFSNNQMWESKGITFFFFSYEISCAWALTKSGCYLKSFPFPLYKEEVGYDSNALSTDAHALLIRQQVGSQVRIGCVKQITSFNFKESWTHRLTLSLAIEGAAKDGFVNETGIISNSNETRTNRTKKWVTCEPAFMGLIRPISGWSHRRILAFISLPFRAYILIKGRSMREPLASPGKICFSIQESRTMKGGKSFNKI